MTTAVQPEAFPDGAVFAPINTLNDFYRQQQHTYQVAALQFDPGKHGALPCFTYCMNMWWIVNAYTPGYGRAEVVKPGEWLAWTGWDDLGCVDVEVNEQFAMEIIEARQGAAG